MKRILQWFKHLLSLLVVVVILLLALPFVIPPKKYIPELQQLLSEQLQESVSIDDMTITLLPIPVLMLHKVRIGTQPLATIDSVKADIDLRTLRDPVKIVPHVDVSGLSLRQAALDKIPLWFKPGDESYFDIRMVRIHRSHLLLKQHTLGPFDARIHLSPQEGFKNALITSDNDTLTVTVKPARKKNYRIEIIAKHWQPRYGPRLLFDELNASLLSGAGSITAQSISGKLYQGSFSGQGELSWGHIWKLHGTLTTKAVQIQPLLALFTSDISASGGMDSQATYSAQAYAVENLARNIKLNATFNIRQGTLYNIDIAKAARGSSQQDVRSGNTRFDEFSGMLNLANREYQFKKLRVTSGLLDGSGKVSVAVDKTVTGQVDVSLRGSAGLINAPLEVVGTAENPELRLRRSALAGAVAGTMVLGPGLGTTIGIKASEMLDKLGDLLTGDPSKESTEAPKPNEPAKTP